MSPDEWLWLEGRRAQTVLPCGHAESIAIPLRNDGTVVVCRHCGATYWDQYGSGTLESIGGPRPK